MSEQLDLGFVDRDPIEALQVEFGSEWPAINKARQRSRGLLEQLNSMLHPVISKDATCVVFGSLARLELTEHSDIDWTLLVDGCAAATHQTDAHQIASCLCKMHLAAPSARGSFGNLTFSHDLIHRIGGHDDTNPNTTQRLLLLLESAPVGRHEAYDRVIEQVLARYIEEDLTGPGDTPYRVPRFLLNDVVRYWRTMAVDFAHKRRARGEAGWALRTAKLRMSRKLMYASGLLSCFSCEFEFISHSGEGYRLRQNNDVLRHLSGLVRTTPLDILAQFVLRHFGEVSGPGKDLFGAYDEFLALLDHPQRRQHLEELKPADADGDSEYGEVRELGRRFQNALTKIFFTCETPVRDLTRRYGVF